MSEYNTKKAAILRFLRTIIPQIPAGTTYLITALSGATIAPWIIPALMFVGATATALDKFLREIKK
jgi:hypothetical protein